MTNPVGSPSPRKSKWRPGTPEYDIETLEIELATVKAERDRYYAALKNHLCAGDMADWIVCAGHPETGCDVCDERGPHWHKLQQVEAERDTAQRQCADAERFANQLEQDYIAELTRLRAEQQDIRIRVESDCSECGGPRVWLHAAQGVLCPMCEHQSAAEEFERAEKAEAAQQALQQELERVKAK